jgi:tRNA(Arg) A34 adenosine deaminase TadA
MTLVLYEHVMRAAIEQALKSHNEGDYAVGAAIAHRDRIVAAAGNRTKRDQNSLNHAEMLVIGMAEAQFGDGKLGECVLYSTLEPCTMCSSAAVWARLGGIVFGADLSDLMRYSRENGNDECKWRYIAMPCEEIIKSAKEPIQIMDSFMREDCLKLFHNYRVPPSPSKAL